MCYCYCIGHLQISEQVALQQLRLQQPQRVKQTVRSLGRGLALEQSHVGLLGDSCSKAFVQSPAEVLCIYYVTCARANSSEVKNVRGRNSKEKEDEKRTRPRIED